MVDCGRFSEQTTVLEQAGTVGDWGDLNWNLFLHSDLSNLIFMVYSSSKVIGRFALSGDAIAHLPRAKNGMYLICVYLIYVSNSSSNLHNRSSKDNGSANDFYWSFR